MKEDGPSIGRWILCRDWNNVVAEYALRDVNKPIGDFALRLGRDTARGTVQLPTVEEVEAELGDRAWQGIEGATNAVDPTPEQAAKPVEEQGAKFWPK